MKRFRKEDYEEWDNGSREQRDWLIFCEQIVNATINDAIRIVEKLHGEYDKYYERLALKNAARQLERYENNEELDVPEKTS